MAEIDREEIRASLESLRGEIGRLAPGPMKSSSWSAHANWKSSSASLNGDFSLTSQVRQPADAAAEVASLAGEAKYDRFLTVARTLSATLQEGRKF